MRSKRFNRIPSYKARQKAISCCTPSAHAATQTIENKP